MPENGCFWTVVFEKTLESPLDCNEIKPLSPEGSQFWIFIGGTDAEAETPVLWPPDVTNWLVRKDPNAGKDWWKEEKGMTEDEMVGWYQQLDGHEFEQALGVDGGQGSLACCTPLVVKELYANKRLNWTDAPTTNAEEAEVEWFYEDLQDLQKLTGKKVVLFIIGDWNAKVGNQEIHGVPGKFGLGIQNEAWQRLTEFCQDWS